MLRQGEDSMLSENVAVGWTVGFGKWQWALSTSVGSPVSLAERNKEKRRGRRDVVVSSVSFFNVCFLPSSSVGSKSEFNWDSLQKRG